MPILFTVLIIIVALLLTGVVLIQNSKGGGLASNVGISTQMMGVKKTADAIEKATWYLVGILVVLCIGSGFAFKQGQSNTGQLDQNIEPLEAPMPMNPQGTPTGLPQNNNVPQQ